MTGLIETWAADKALNLGATAVRRLAQLLHGECDSLGRLLVLLHADFGEECDLDRDVFYAWRDREDLVAMFAGALSGELRGSASDVQRVADVMELRLVRTPLQARRALAERIAAAVFRAVPLVVEGGDEATRLLAARMDALGGDVRELLAKRPHGASSRDALKRAHYQSIGRCIQGWQALGVAHAMAEQLAHDETVGSLPAATLAAGPVTVLIGDMGVGKSLAGERLHQAAIATALDNPGAPAPVWLLAADVGGDLDRAVSEAETGPADDDHPVALVVDGLDEPGPVAATALLGQARVLAQARPGSRILLTTRLIAGLGNPDERRTVKPLERADASALMDRIHPAAPKQWYRLAEPLQEAALRPFFAVAAAVLASVGETPSAPAQVIDRLVRRAAGHKWRALRGPLVELSVRSLRRDGATVRAQDLVPSDVLDDLLATRIVVEQQGCLRFPLILFAQWFAAQGIIEGAVGVDELLDDVARLENWRFPLAIAVDAAPTVVAGAGDAPLRISSTRCFGATSAA